MFDIIFLDFEVFKEDWMIVFSDTNTRKFYSIVNDKEKLLAFYKHYENEVMIGYNINHYDRYVLQAILCDFNPYEISSWIIEQGKQGWQFSELLRTFPIISYDCLVKDKSLKQIECSLGMEIKESSVPFNIGRKLTASEITETLSYCEHDVKALMETFLQDGFFMSPQDEWKSSCDIIKEFSFPKSYLSKTKAQLGCAVLGAKKVQLNDEFDILTPNLPLGKYEYIREWFLNPENHWYSKLIDGKKQPVKNEFITQIAGVKHVFAWGGVHASVDKGIYDGILLMCDFASLYPNIMVEYDLVSRGVKNPRKYKELLEKRIELKRMKISAEKVYKVVLNGSYGQMGYENSQLYDKRNANNVCVHGQIIALYLVSKLEQVGMILNTNTDGVLVKVNTLKEKEKVEEICKQVAEEVRIGIDVEEYNKFIVKDVNNYVAIKPNGKYKAIGSYVKELNPLEKSISIVNKAVRDWYVYNNAPEKTVKECEDILEFQIIAKAGGKYECAMKNNLPLPEKCNRVFASKDQNDGGIFKKHKNGGIAKIQMTPEHCFVINEDVRGMTLPEKLDKQWYIDLAKKRISEFVR